MAMLCTFVCILAFQTHAFAQSRIISGKVIDAATSEAMAGVTVVEKGTTSVAVSDNAGNYSIALTRSGADTLLFSFIGFETQAVAVGNNTTINISLRQDVKMLNEIVVVAYGSSTRGEQTGSITQVDAKKLEDVPIASVDGILQGKVSGLQISSYSGQPGGELNIHLRGVGSITAGSSPLFVVDGIPINSGPVGDGYAITWTSNGLAGINPNDIESVTVLKDASATAIYGSRGANGVIIITTKKGKSGKTKFQFNSDFGVNSVAYSSDIRPLNTDEYVALTIEGMENANYTDSHMENILNSINAYNGVNTNWLDEVTQTGMQNSYNFSAQGGDDKTKFFLSLGYFKQEGATIDSRFDRLSGSVNLEHKVSDKLNLHSNLMLSKSDQNTPYQSGYFRSPIISAYVLLPMMQPYDSLGNINMDEDEFYSIYNPLAIVDLDTNYYNNKKIIGSVGADYTIIKGLNISTQLSLDQNYTDEFLYANPFYGDGKAVNGWANESYTDLTNWVWTTIADYNAGLLRDDLNLDVKVGHESQQSQQKILFAYGEGFPPNTSIYVLSVSALPGDISSSIFEYAFESYFSNLQLNYKSKYLLTGSFRRDGSSRFGINNRYGSFYSVGFSWNIDEENFFTLPEFISALRLRTSYGQNGNSDIGNYDAQADYYYGGSYYGNPASSPATSGNANLTWEKNKPFNIGIDASFLRDRINITADWYHRTTSDLLLNVPVSQTSGFSTQLQNVGAMVNHGIELEVNAIVLHLHDFKWVIDANFATNKNEITQLYNHQQFVAGYNSVYTASLFLYREGESYGTYYLPLWAGVDPATGDALWYTDSTMTETTNDISLAKDAATGNAQPKFFGGFNSRFQWKGLSLSTQFNYVFGNQVYDLWGGFFESDGANPLYNSYTSELDRWQQPGDVTDVPKYVYYNQSGSNTASTRFLYDGDYIRLREVTLSYEFSPSMIEGLHMNALKVYVRGTNWYTWVKDKDIPFDPDVSYGYGDVNLPNIKSLIAGITIGF